MANQIAAFFETMGHAEAVDGVADHINKFWEPRMRRHFFEIVERGGDGLNPLVLQAAAKVKRPKEAAA
ncbi:formate dehydrogenase subunit delta [Chelativorans sp. AA-79]|uniref:formate dehydrogenase subunit delta n=1 Tax=Chelativorans sp. AA-79 TaxID=3028735 RepID=UPI0023F8C9CE|nr:formate dehydrogenase subunit delta [Chelativorans sp. AA-79]WEX09484.1 formate dehydrogenase subunit delta [Chelativorans sp. AA-79]